MWKYSEMQLWSQYPQDMSSSTRKQNKKKKTGQQHEKPHFHWKGSLNQNLTEPTNQLDPAEHYLAMIEGCVSHGLYSDSPYLRTCLPSSLPSVGPQSHEAVGPSAPQSSSRHCRHPGAAPTRLQEGPVSISPNQKLQSQHPGDLKVGNQNPRILSSLLRMWKTFTVCNWMYGHQFGAVGFLVYHKFCKLSVVIGKPPDLHMGMCRTVSAQTQASQEQDHIRLDHLSCEPGCSFGTCT